MVSFLVSYVWQTTVCLRCNSQSSTVRMEFFVEDEEARGIIRHLLDKHARLAKKSAATKI